MDIRAPNPEYQRNDEPDNPPLAFRVPHSGIMGREIHIIVRQAHASSPFPSRTPIPCRGRARLGRHRRPSSRAASLTGFLGHSGRRGEAETGKIVRKRLNCSLLKGAGALVSEAIDQSDFLIKERLDCDDWNPGGQVLHERVQHHHGFGGNVRLGIDREEASITIDEDRGLS